jgi:hypothetical protein
MGNSNSAQETSFSPSDKKTALVAEAVSLEWKRPFI